MESVLMQINIDFEYVVVDGASTDDSLDVITEIGDKIIKRGIRYTSICEPDNGIYNAMNKGINISHGEYLLFLNSGDFFITPEVLYRVFNNYCYADILCARCAISDNGKVIWITNPPNNVTFGTLYFTGLAHQSTFIKRELFEKYGNYDESFRYNADIEFWYRTIIDNNASTQRIDVITTDYNLDGISEKNKNDINFNEEHLKILSKPLYQKILPDYIDYKSKITVYNEYSWISNHKILRFVLKNLRKLYKRFRNFK